MKKIKTFESFLDLFKKDEPITPHTTYYWTDEEKEELLSMGFKFIDTRKTNSTGFGYFEIDGMFLVKTATGRSGREDWYYEIIKKGKVLKEFSSISEVEKWMDR